MRATVSTFKRFNPNVFFCQFVTGEHAGIHTHTHGGCTHFHPPTVSLSLKRISSPFEAMAGNLQFKFFQCRLTFFSFSSSFAIWARSLHTPKANSLLYIYVFFLNVGYRDRMGRKVGRESWREFCFNPVDTKNHSRGFDFAGGNFPSISSSLVRL